MTLTLSSTKIWTKPYQFPAALCSRIHYGCTCLKSQSINIIIKNYSGLNLRYIYSYFEFQKFFMEYVSQDSSCCIISFILSITFGFQNISCNTKGRKAFKTQTHVFWTLHFTNLLCLQSIEGEILLLSYFYS